MKQNWTSFCRISDNDLTKQNGHMKLSTKCNLLMHFEQRALYKFYFYLLICGVTQNVFFYFTDFPIFQLDIKTYLSWSQPLIQPQPCQKQFMDWLSVSYRLQCSHKGFTPQLYFFWLKSSIRIKVKVLTHNETNLDILLQDFR